MTHFDTATHCRQITKVETKVLLKDDSTSQFVDLTGHIRQFRFIFLQFWSLDFVKAKDENVKITQFRLQVMLKEVIETNITQNMQPFGFNMQRDNISTDLTRHEIWEM